MSKLTVYWNSVTAKDDVNLKTLASLGSLDVSNATAGVDIAEGCRGIYYRALISTELDFNAFLTGIKLGDVRKARNEPDYSLLFAPKCKGEQSIGVLRIVRPKRFGKISGIKNKLSEAKVDQSAKEFEVLLESTEFILEDVQEQMAERFQLQETFGDFNVFFFGRRAEIFTYSGSLLNAKGNLQWRNQFLDQYENFLRGSKCAELKARAYLLYDDVIREGFILSAAVNQSSSVDSVVKFSFTLLVTGKRILGQIPKTRTGVITIASDVKKVEGGITDFKFIRASNPDLPSVGVGSENFHFQVLDRPGGTTIPADLEQILRRKSLDAIAAAGGEVKFASQDTVVEQDVLLDFIHLGDLKTQAKSSSRLISGGTEPGLGDNIATQLIGGTLTVDQLTLIEAISAADSLVQNSSQQIGASAVELRPIVDKLASDVTRVSSPPTPIAIKDAALYDEAGQFVLSSENNGTLLKTLIEKMKPISDLNDDMTGATSEILKSATAKILSLIEDETLNALADAVFAYVSSFLLLERPTGGRFITDSDLQGATNLSGLSNALAFVKKQKISKIQELLHVQLAALVQPAVESALAGLSNSPSIGLISSKTGLSKERVEFNEGMIVSASQFSGAPGIPLSPVNTKFLMGLLVYVTGIVAEKAGIPLRLSSDYLGATVLKSEPSVFPKYFETSYRDSLVDLTAPLKHHGIIIYGGELQIVDLPAGTFLQIPIAIADFKSTFRVGNASSLVSRSVLSSGAAAAGLTGVAISSAVDLFDEFINTVDIPFPTTSFNDQFLQSYGYVRLDPGQAAKIRGFNSQNLVVMFRGHKRESAQTTPAYGDVQAGVTDFFLFKLRLDKFVVDGEKATTAFKVTAKPVGQSYFSEKTFPNDFVTCSIENISKSTQNVANVITQGFDKILPVVQSAFGDIVSKGKVPSSESQTAVVNEELGVSRFITGGDTPIASITAAEAAFAVVGVKTTSFVEFAKMVPIETSLFKTLTDLRDNLKNAVDQAQTPEGKKAAEVARSDVSVRNTRCGEGSTQSFSGPENTTGTFG